MRPLIEPHLRSLVASHDYNRGLVRGILLAHMSAGGYIPDDLWDAYLPVMA